MFQTTNCKGGTGCGEEEVKSSRRIIRSTQERRMASQRGACFYVRLRACDFTEPVASSRPKYLIEEIFTRAGDTLIKQKRARREHTHTPYWNASKFYSTITESIQFNKRHNNSTCLICYILMSFRCFTQTRARLHVYCTCTSIQSSTSPLSTPVIASPNNWQSLTMFMSLLL